MSLNASFFLKEINSIMKRALINFNIYLINKIKIFNVRAKRLHTF